MISLTEEMAARQERVKGSTLTQVLELALRIANDDSDADTCEAAILSLAALELSKSALLHARYVDTRTEIAHA